MAIRIDKSTAKEEISAIEDLMNDLEKRLRRLSGEARSQASGASEEIGDYVTEALDRVMSRVKKSASNLTQTATDEAARFGGTAMKKVADEVEHRPLLFLAAAAGVGFLIGLASRR